MKNDPKTLKALEKVLAALGPLKPEARRQVIEATHALIEIDPGRQNMDQGGPGAGPDKPAKKRK